MLTLATEIPNTQQRSLTACSFVYTGLVKIAHFCETLDDDVRSQIQHLAAPHVHDSLDLIPAFQDYLRHPNSVDAPLVEVARHFMLTPVEILAVALATAAEHDLLVGHILSHLQQPLAFSRPTIGLIAQAYAPSEVSKAVYLLGQGNVIRCGLLQLRGDDVPLPERQMCIPLPLALTLQGMESSWPGTALITFDQFPIPLGKTTEDHATALAKRLFASDSSHRALIIRAGDFTEGRAAAAQVCSHCSTRAVHVQTDQLMGLAPWLFLNSLLPVFTQWLAPGDRHSIPTIPNFDGPLIVLTGPEGDFESEDRVILNWQLQPPSSAEREELWNAAIDNPQIARRVATEHRHTAGRIAALAACAREEAGNNTPVDYAHLRSVSRRGDSVGLGALAELITDEVDNEAIVVSPALRQELELLVTRCRLRERFSASLGPSIQARYRPSVRALFVGPSGTGKTLAVAWLATRLGIPLFRVDLSAITSKYIGETEKNLSRLLARAEQSEVILLFDEADALFGKRTDIHESNDRFANAQTNYLLQRMESYDGITILTSNGRSRFDDAFSRRFDAMLTFPLPGPEERRALWLAHLGPEHGVNSAQLNLLSAIAELTGGQIRNAVLRSAVAAAQDEMRILYRHLLMGLNSEYRKLSRQLPNELKQAESTLA